MTTTRRRAFFFYQQGMSGRWGPVIVFDEKPKTSFNKELNELRVMLIGGVGTKITEPVELTDEDFILTDPEDFYTLKLKYPRKEPT